MHDVCRASYFFGFFGEKKLAKLAYQRLGWRPVTGLYIYCIIDKQKNEVESMEWIVNLFKPKYLDWEDYVKAVQDFEQKKITTTVTDVEEVKAENRTKLIFSS